MPDSNSLQDSVFLGETLAMPVTSPDRYTMLLGNVILGSGFSSRLYQDLRIRSGYVYSVGSELDWSRTRADYSVSFGADGENVEKARQLVLRDLKEMQTSPVSEAELMRAKAELLRRLPMQRASVGGIAGQYLRLTELGLPIDSAQTAAGRYLAITAADIQRAFAKWLRPDDLVEVVKGPPRIGHGQVRASGQSPATDGSLQRPRVAHPGRDGRTVPYVRSQAEASSERLHKGRRPAHGEASVSFIAV